MNQEQQPSRPEVETGEGSSVEQPAKLMRFGSMVAATLREVREVSLDAEGRKRLFDLHRRTIDQLKGLLSEDLQEELEEEVLFDFTDGGPSEAELRIAQARFLGWLEGLFRGLQASAMSRQMAAQLEVQRRGLQGGEESREPTDLPGYL